jgi:hypothetical protein
LITLQPKTIRIPQTPMSHTKIHKMTTSNLPGRELVILAFQEQPAHHPLAR